MSQLHRSKRCSSGIGLRKISRGWKIRGSSTLVDDAKSLETGNNQRVPPPYHWTLPSVPESSGTKSTKLPGLSFSKLLSSTFTRNRRLIELFVLLAKTPIPGLWDPCSVHLGLLNSTSSWSTSILLIWGHFSNISKRIQKFEEFQKLLEIKPHEMLRPCQMRWLS